MKFRVVHQPTANHARSAFRVVEQTTGREVEWINRYLDLECLRRVPTAGWCSLIVTDTNANKAAS